MATYYEPSDGDYNEDDFGKFFDDIQAEADFDIGEFPEICTSLEEDNTILVLGANEECDNWIWERSFPIPQGWDIERVNAMFGGNVYLQPSTRPTQLAHDAGDSAVSTSSFHASAESTSQSDTTPTQRK